MLFLSGVRGVSGAAESVPEAPPSFRRDVMPVFFRAGCNAGTCHGSARGKDGFMLSLFGYDPKGDYARIVEQMPGRRVNPAVPERSLLLLKSVAAVPHTGGKLFTPESVFYKTLRDWIAAGAPDDEGAVPETVDVVLSRKSVVFDQAGGSAGLTVTALASDGTKRDVTGLALFFSNNTSVADIRDGQVTAKGAGDTSVFARFGRFTVGAEVIVLPPAEGFAWPNPPQVNFIDKLVFDRLQKLRMVPSELCDDETFLRRVTIDLAARVPTVEEYRAFMADGSEGKRHRKIDELLQSDGFTELWTTIWSEHLRNKGSTFAPNATLPKASDALQGWIRTQMRSGRPLNEFVAELVGASGSNISAGPPNFYTMMVNKWNVDPKALAADVSQLLLGVQIQCAECHNHPFDRWTMDDYYSFVSFFTGVKRINGVEPRERRIFFDTTVAPAKHLVDERPMPARVLGAIEPVPSGSDPRKALAAWMTAPENRLFRENLANRIWAQLMGRGIVEPVDDVRVSNPPSNPELLEALGTRLAELRFDLRGLVREICRSRTYQLSVTPNETNKLDTRQFSHGRLRRLRADVLLDALTDVTGVPAEMPNFPLGTRAVAFHPRNAGGDAQGSSSKQFFHNFGLAQRNSVAASETKREATLAQALHLIAGDTLRARLASGGVLKRIMAGKSSAEAVFEELFIHVLGRRPEPEEERGLLALADPAARDAGLYEDVFWSLLNSTEFLFNH
ncbi:MAG: hypothetical protein RLZZ244_2719 [Verrucomicrobiota bacterium]